MERVLFYLPVVTPWWFDNIVAHMIRALSECTEVHVLVPPLWRNTGIGPEQLQSCALANGVVWHIADGSSACSLRTTPDDPEALIEFVRSINPDLIFCRSVDVATPERFPGTVRHLVEAGSPPLTTCSRWVTLPTDFWHHGALPDLPEEEWREIEQTFAPVWEGLKHRMYEMDEFRLNRSEALRLMGLPQDRKVVALPLEYEHEESFLGLHHRFQRNLALLHYVAEHMDNDWVIAVADHPLNYKHVDNTAVYEAIAALRDRARLVPNPAQNGYATALLVKHCDGLIVQNTKAIFSGALYGKPILRLSHRPTAHWLGAHGDMESFKTAIDMRGTGAAVSDRFRQWLGYHTLHEIIDATAISGPEILDRIERPFARERLRGGLEQYQAYQRECPLVA